MKGLVAGRTMLEIDKAGEECWRPWTMDAGSLIGKFGVLAEYVGLGTGEPRSEAVRQQTADGVATIC
jgi:hypothetical protein